MSLSTTVFLSTLIFCCWHLLSCTTVTPNRRCGTKDESDPTISTSSARHTPTTAPHALLPKKLVPKFNKTIISWKITTYPEQLDDQTTMANVDAAATAAFLLWSSACNLIFFQTNSPTPDIEVKFESEKRHNLYCNEDFQSLDYAHYLKSTQNPAVIHMNDNVHWTTSRSNSTEDKVNLIYVFAHEIGHVLSFAHNNLTESIMFRHYFAYHSGPKVTLSAGDIAAARKLYGKKQKSNCAQPLLQSAPNKYATCVQIYDFQKCGGDKLDLGEVRFLQLKNLAKRTGGNWSYQVSSIRVAPNCRLQYCKGDRNCDNVTNTSPTVLSLPKMGDQFDNQIEQISCSCSPCLKTVPTNGVTLNSGSCAIGYPVPDPMCESFPLHIGVGEIDIQAFTALNNFTWQIASVQVQPDCVLKLTRINPQLTLVGGRNGNRYHLFNNIFNLFAYCNCTAS